MLWVTFLLYLGLAGGARVDFGGALVEQATGPYNHFVLNDKPFKDRIQGFAATLVKGTQDIWTKSASFPGGATPGYADLTAAPGALGVGSFAVSLWVKKNTNDERAILGNRNDAARGNFFSLRASSTAITAALDDNVTAVTVSVAKGVATGEWTHLAVRRTVAGTTQTVTVWLNGKLVGTGSSTKVTNLGGASSLLAGAEPLSSQLPAFYLDGSIATVKIYRSAVTDAEIVALSALEADVCADGSGLTSNRTECWAALRNHFVLSDTPLKDRVQSTPATLVNAVAVAVPPNSPTTSASFGGPTNPGYANLTRAPGVFGPNAFTASLWFKKNTDGSQAVLSSKKDAGRGKFFRLLVGPRSVMMEMDDLKLSYPMNTAVGVAKGVWTHLAFRRVVAANTMTVSLWINGKVMVSEVYNFGVPNLGGDYDLLAGGEPLATPDTYLDGSIASIKIFGAAAPDTQIANLASLQSDVCSEGYSLSADRTDCTQGLYNLFVLNDQPFQDRIQGFAGALVNVVQQVPTKAALFSGGKGYVNLTPAAGAFGVGPFAVSLWFKKLTSIEKAVLGSRSTTARGNFFAIRASSTKITVDLDDLTTALTVSVAKGVVTGVWTHLVVRREVTGTTQTVTVWLSGKLVGTGTSDKVTNLNGASPLLAGAEPLSSQLPAFYLEGSIATVRTYRRILPDAEIVFLSKLVSDVCMDGNAFTSNRYDCVAAGPYNHWVLSDNPLKDRVQGSPASLVNAVTKLTPTTSASFGGQHNRGYASLSSAPGALGTSSFTVSLWVKKTSSDNKGLLGNRNDENRGRFFFIHAANDSTTVALDDNNVQLWVYPATNSPTLGVPTGVWTHVAVRRAVTGNTQTVTTFVNGKVVATKSSVGVTNLAGAYDMQAGAEPLAAKLIELHLLGEMSTIKIFRGPASDSQIASLATLVSDVCATGYKFDANKTDCVAVQIQLQLSETNLKELSTKSPEEIQSAFHSWDKDAEGNLDQTEIRAMVGPGNEMDQLIKEADKDGNGLLAFPEFQQLLKLVAAS